MIASVIRYSDIVYRECGTVEVLDSAADVGFNAGTISSVATDGTVNEQRGSSTTRVRNAAAKASGEIATYSAIGDLRGALPDFNAATVKAGAVAIYCAVGQRKLCREISASSAVNAAAKSAGFVAFNSAVDEQGGAGVYNAAAVAED